MKRIINTFKGNKRLIKLALPIFLELFFQFLVGMIDSLQLSSDQGAVSAINQTNTVVNVVTLVFSVLSMSSIILITQFKQLHDDAQVKRIYNLSFYFNLLCGVAVSLFLFFGAEFIFRSMGVEESYFDKAVIYMKINGGFSFVLSLTTVFSAFLRSNKLMIQSTIVTGLLNIFNVVGNALAIFVFHAGITGVAISSVISRVVGLIIIIIMYVHYIHTSLHPKNIIPFPGKLFGRLLHIGLPSAGENLSYSLSQLVILIILNHFFLISQGVDVNIRGYIINFTTIVYMFSNAIAQATQVCLGETVATREYDKTYKLVNDTFLMSAIVTLICSLIFVGIGYPILNFFLKIDDPVSKAKAMETVLIILGIDVALEFGRSGNIPYVRSLQAVGDIYYPVIISIICCWVVAVGGSLLFSSVFHLGVIGIWISCALDENIRNIIFHFRWKSKKWEKFNLIKDLN